MANDALSDLFTDPAGSPAPTGPANTGLGDVFADHNPGARRMYEVLLDDDVFQIVANRHDRIFVSSHNHGTLSVDGVFPGPQQYIDWVNELMPLTDVGYRDVTTARTSFIEGSFAAERSPVHGSVHIATREVTRGVPRVTIRKQPRDTITLDEMVAAGMLSPDMRWFLEQSVRGRLNIVVSGGSGAGKTTLARALSNFIDPAQCVLTVEEIDELHLADRLPNVASLTTYREASSDGAVVRRTDLADLVREGLRMRADRIWVGETRGAEAYALVKACNSGHDGSVTTLHADDGGQAVRQLTSYVMEHGLTEQVARDQVAQAFHLVIQITRAAYGRRVISEITELEPVREGAEQRRNTLYRFDFDSHQFQVVGRPTDRLLRALARYGVSF